MTRLHLAFLTLFTALAGCGGGGGSGGTVIPPPPPPPATQSASGIWVGTLSEGGTDASDARCLVTEAGEIACILFDPANAKLAGAARGTLQVTDTDQVSGSGTTYAAPGYVLADDTSVVADFAISSGTVSEGATIDILITILGESGTFTGTFDPEYDRGSSLATVAAAYSTFDVFGDPASFSIDANGMLFSQTDSGCVANGQVSVVDPQFNGYDVEMTVTDCGTLDGDYAGLAVTTDAEATNDVFLFGVFNETTAILGAPVK